MRDGNRIGYVDIGVTVEITPGEVRAEGEQQRPENGSVSRQAKQQGIFRDLDSAEVFRLVVGRSDRLQADFKAWGRKGAGSGRPGVYSSRTTPSSKLVRKVSRIGS